MVRATPLIAIVLLSNCGPWTDNQKADALASEFDRLTTATERCRFAAQIVSAYAAAGNGDKVSEWQHKQRVECLMKDTQESVGIYGK
ncbi:hypothetical protein [Sphingobium amiense]|uniref:hypothetical protein n=1 Tax=Sphingobium amiense TaxID=135719 RepID=UPI000837A8C6|nr:hypothetical protein [Sphingobium amiense]